MRLEELETIAAHFIVAFAKHADAFLDVVRAGERLAKSSFQLQKAKPTEDEWYQANKDCFEFNEAIARLKEIK